MVSEIKAFPTKTGAMMYTMIVDGNRYGCGNKPPSAKAGDTVSFTATQNGNFLNADTRTLSVVANAAAAVQQVGGLAKPAATAGGDYKQDVISRQSSYNTAIAFVAAVVAAGALPGTTAKTTPAEKYALLEALVDEKAAEFLLTNTEGKTKFKPRAAKPVAGAVSSSSDVGTIQEWE
jgi:hypothetical protein